MIELVIAILAGVLCGVLTGLVPGLHINTFIPFLFLLRGSWLTGFVLGVVVSHSLFDFFPAIFLGVPEESTALSILPAHKMVLRGKALKAFQLSLFGGLFSSLFAVASVPFLIPLSKLDLRIPVLAVLVATILFMLLSSSRKILTAAIFVLAGILGLNTLGEPNSFLALFSGFFGASTIINSLMSNPEVPKQKLVEARVPAFKPVFLGSLAGLFSGLTPGISSSISGLAVKKLGKVSDEDFLVVLGGANTVYAFMAIAAIFIIGRPRSGAGLLLGDSAGMFMLVGGFLLALGLASFLAWKLAPMVVLVFNTLPTKGLNIVALGFLVALTLWFGVFPLFIVSTSLGLVCLLSGVRRNTCMASILLPAVLYYLP
ncbi:MAG: tripartite tricarboxylate transporter permease [Candidatus Diapherotrites archaeon]|nr:tripartite tricarboxylate transporter permease [Candidatus Diapherotrites archaeon]